MNTTTKLSCLLALALASCISQADAASSGITTLQAKTAPAVTQSLTGAGANAEGSSLAFAKADHTHAVSGKLPVANGGTNSNVALTGGTIMVSDLATGSIIEGPLGTSSTVLHGTAGPGHGGSPFYAQVALGSEVSGTLSEALGGTGAGALTCTNQFMTSNGTLYSCSTPTLASAQYANQGTSTTLLHGNSPGNPSWSAVSLTADVTGTLPEARGGTNAGALTCTNQFLTSDGTSYSCQTAGVNSSLVGNGVGTAFGLNLANANTWTANQTFSTATANGTSVTCNGNGTGNGANFTGGAAGASGTGTNAYGINVTGGSASGGGIPGPGINTTGGQGASIGAPGILGTGGAANGTNTAGPQGGFFTGGAATGNAAGTTGGIGGTGSVSNGANGGPTVTGIGGAGGPGATGTGGVGGAASGAGTGGAGGVGAFFTGGVGGTGGTLAGQGGVGVQGLGGNGGATVNGNGGNGGTFTGGNATGAGTNGDGLSVGSGSGGTGTTRGYVLRLAQNNSIMAHTNRNPLTSDPTSLFNGDDWISGTTTAMTDKVRLNGVTQPRVTFGANGSAALQTKRAVAGCATAASAGAVCTTVVTWAVAFPDANYACACSGVAITSGVPAYGGVTAKVAASCTVQTVAVTAAAAQFTNIECIAVHD